MTLREIAKMIPLGIDEYHQADWSKAIATLLNAVVEERIDVIREKRKWAEGTQYSKGQPVNVPDRESCRTQALRELNLEGVWPEKEHS